MTIALLLGQRAGYSAQMRFALVIGNDEYKDAKLATAANDAGLVADALQAAGFTVTGARNLDQATLRESFREFLGQVSAAGPDTVALVYLAGFGLQFEGENYFVPVDADIQRDVDIPLQAIRISDLTQPLAALPGPAKIVILDASRQNPFARGSQPLASGLALVDPAPSMAIAFSAAPGTVSPDEPGPYGAFATSFTEMIAAGGLTLDDIFARLRLRVSDLTKGAEVPWYASQINGPFFMTERSAEAPPPPTVVPLADVRDKPMRDFRGVDDAYEAALERDTIDGYEQFLAVYPNSPFSHRVAAMLAVRREAIIWRRCVHDGTPPAYWSYLRRYPRGPHVGDARRALARLAAAFEPPPSFAYIDFGVPPPPPDELVFVDRPVLIFEGPGYAPPPPPPLFFLPPRPREFAVLPPPPPPRERFFLPIPVAVAVPPFVRPPATVAVRPPPPGASGPNGRPAITVSLPSAVHPESRPGGSGPEGRPGPGGPAVAPLPHAGPPGTAAPPPTAFVKPPERPPHGPGPAPTSIKPGLPPPRPPGPEAPASIKPPPPAPHQSAPTAPASIKPPPPPPHQSAPTAPASIKPPPPPPHPSASAPASIKPPPPPHPPAPAPASIKPPPPPHPPAPAPASIKPPPPPPHPPAPAPAAARPGPPPPARPACPPGKRPAEENGHPVCK